MPTARLKYKGDLRTEAEHIASGTVIVNDAPTDNHGKGEAFSPTDLLSTSLATCMITVMAIHAEHNNIPFNEVRAEVTKIMASGPRRISKIKVLIEMSGKELNDGIRQTLERIAMACPVAKSLASQIDQDVTFRYI